MESKHPSKAKSRSRRRAPRSTQRGGTLIASASTLAEARLLLQRARGAGATAVLVSPPDAAAYLGVGYFAGLIENARAEFPDVRIDAIIDCGGDPGWALAALRMGFKSIVLGGDSKARLRVAAIAKKCGARLVSRPPATKR